MFRKEKEEEGPGALGQVRAPYVEELGLRLCCVTLGWLVNLSEPASPAKKAALWVGHQIMQCSSLGVAPTTEQVRVPGQCFSLLQV